MGSNASPADRPGWDRGGEDSGVVLSVTAASGGTAEHARFDARRGNTSSITTSHPKMGEDAGFSGAYGRVKANETSL